jgi:hypothetical protein
LSSEIAAKQAIEAAFANALEASGYKLESDQLEVKRIVMDETTLAERIREVLETRDIDQVNRFAFWCGINGAPYDRIASFVLLSLDEEVRHFWMGERCPCIRKPSADASSSDN